MPLVLSGPSVPLWESLAFGTPGDTCHPEPQHALDSFGAGPICCSDQILGECPSLHPLDKAIVSFRFDEVIVPAHPGVINSPSLAKPLHMLPVGGKASWSVQFDELPKLIVGMVLADGSVGIGEFYRDHEWPRIEAICANLLGRSILDLPLQDLPLPLCREYDGFECAIWDAYAKSLGVPMHRLLG